ncbi:endoglucanase V-like protein [Lactarius quietus]|nr:endoglucanase V-like protein [Lactarius quietus]
MVTTVVRGSVQGLEPRTQGGYLQKSSDNATFTVYWGCQTPACGQVGHGYTAAMSQLSFGAPGGQGGGDACGRCFRITSNEDPYSPWFEGPFASIVVKVTDLCPYQAGEDWCGQSRSDPRNQFGAPVHFDLCADSGASSAFFPEGRGAMKGYYEEVSCAEWNGWDGPDLWNGACLLGENAGFWPKIGCGNKGMELSPCLPRKKNDS